MNNKIENQDIFALYGILGFSFFGFIQLRSIADGMLLFFYMVAIGGYSLLNSDKILRIAPSRSIWMLLLIGWSVASVLWSIDPGYSLYRVIYFILAACCCIVITNKLPKKNLFLHVKNFLIFSLVLNFIVIALVPSIGLVNGISGLHYSKNQFGAILALSAIILLTVENRRYVDIFFGIMALLVLSISNNKTSLVIVLFILVIFMWSKFFSLCCNLKLPKPSVFFLVTAVVLIMYSDRIIDYIIFDIDDDFLTGRGQIWRLMIDYSHLNSLGVGFGAMWMSGETSIMYESFFSPSTEWMQKIEQGHNGYLETFANLGVIGCIMLIGLIYSILYSVITYESNDVNKPAMLAIVFFSIMHNFSETSYLYYFAPVWIFFLIVWAYCIRPNNADK